MILGFTTEINGKPTYFIEKIWRYVYKKHLNLIGYHRYRDEAAIANVIDQWDYEFKLYPKLHAIREDKNNRWKKGNKIDFFINVRRKDMFRFAPVLPVVSIQKIELKYHDNTFLVYIDNKLFFFGNRDFSVNEFENHEGMLQLAHNDGFDSIQDFCSYFSKDYVGKIIHWTNFKY